MNSLSSPQPITAKLSQLVAYQGHTECMQDHILLMGTHLVPRFLSECSGGTLCFSGEHYLGRWSTIWGPPGSGGCQARGYALVELTFLGERLPKRQRAVCVESLSREYVLITFCWAPSLRGSLKLLRVYLAWHCLWTDKCLCLDCAVLWIDRGIHRNLGPTIPLWQGRERQDQVSDSDTHPSASRAISSIFDTCLDQYSNDFCQPLECPCLKLLMAYLHQK
jgi:hypothetical protein